MKIKYETADAMHKTSAQLITNSIFKFRNYMDFLQATLLITFSGKTTFVLAIMFEFFSRKISTVK